MLKQSIGIGMLFLAGHAYSADIAVTILDDVSADDKECSLREAIEFVNLGQPEDGYMGCGGGKDETYTATIVLKSKAIYTLKNKLNIKKSLVLQTQYDDNVNETIQPGTNNATLRMTGQEQILWIDDLKASSDLASVYLKEVSLEGCKEAACKTQQGGLIYNHEYLNLSYVKLDGGRAVQGGAIYNAGDDLTNIANNGLIEIKNTLIENNQAEEGGMIYSQLPRFRISNSVLRHNTTTNNQTRSANIYTANIPATAVTFPFKTNYIVNSTLYGNKGAVLLIVDGIGVNNVTIVANTSGVRFDVKNTKAGYIANSILIGNPHGESVAQDCQFLTGDQSILQNNLSSSSCTTGDPVYPNQIESISKVIAGNSIEGACASFTEDPSSILCPYRQVDNQFLGYFRPRTLPTYKSWEQSLIISKGKKAITDYPLQECETSDQRSESRGSFLESCERGAIEIVIPTTIALLGKDLFYGETANFSLLDKLGDSDLLPKEHCLALVGQHPKGEAWQDGCFIIEQEPHVSSKGVVTLDALGNIHYQPNGNWHGEDIFTIKVVTTTTKFASSDPYLSLKVQIGQAPKGEMQSNKVKTSGGSLGIWSILGLFALIAGRRLKQLS